ncbi:hypothetical protein D9757_014516 [Collybiopsis confluens]|uniref:C2H2-type domain-containing protein n=1 Tax=Collybiopsis confluens TaxID=2823264 RepID=A0A8H5LMK6_9AGAR|nr:hypothetical protein D9757_014516 [Collybiopsis confluens]
MDFSCAVCKRSFSRPQDRLSHLTLTHDPKHRAHLRQLNQFEGKRFREAAASARNARTRRTLTKSRNISNLSTFSSFPMEVDAGYQAGLTNGHTDSINEDPELLDEEGSIVSEDDYLETQERQEEVAFERVMDVTAQEILEHTTVFDFLPDPVLKEEVAESVSDDDQPWVWDWHPTAGQVFGKKPTVHERWSRLFPGKDAEAIENYKPFASRLEWEVAQWVVQERVSQKSFDRLLKIPQLKEKLGLTFNNARSMLQKVDKIPERCGPWFTKRLSFKDRPDEHFIVRHRNALDAIRALWGDPAFSNDLVYKPVKLFRHPSRTSEDRVFNEMWTGGFWNAAQERIPEGGTIAPVIIATDKTSLTQFSGSKSAYPVYLTLGNIPKALRRKPGSRACVLIAYLHADKLSKVGLSDTTLKLRNYELFHRSMAVVLEHLKAAGDPDGYGVEMVGGDGVVRRVFPILATYVADYPEQCLVTCTKYGTCPKCQQKADALQDASMLAPRDQFWTIDKIQTARKELKDRGGRAVHDRTMVDDVAGGNYQPFWEGFPLTDIHRCIAPDVLHQLYQGIFKYLVEWVQQVVGEKELDERIRTLPPTHGVRHFAKGISVLSQLSGGEHRHIARVLLACLVGKLEPEGIAACRSMLHFIQLSQYSSHDHETLKYMVDTLRTWYRHREYFIDKEVRQHFNIPKFHALLHYVQSIRWLGTTDNYNTEAFERFHIDWAKEGWAASNKRDHFPQMVLFISRKEKIASYDFYRSWAGSNMPQLDTNSDEQEITATVTKLGPGSDNDSEECISVGRTKLRQYSQAPEIGQSMTIHLTKHPSEPRKKLSHILVSHSAPGFITELKRFLCSFLASSDQPAKHTTLQSSLPFDTVDVWHRFNITPMKLLDDEVEKAIVRASPISRTASIPRYDTVIVLDGENAESTAVQGCRAARLRVIFRLPETVNRYGFPSPSPLNWPAHPLAYVTWYTRFARAPDKGTGMYKVQPVVGSNGIPLGAIIPLSDIRQPCMLVPSRAEWEKGWTSENVLDQCPSFFVNNLQNKYSYQTIY